MLINQVSVFHSWLEEEQEQASLYQQVSTILQRRRTILAKMIAILCSIFNSYLTSKKLCMANTDVVLWIIVIIIIIISGHRSDTGGSSCSPGAHLPPGSQGCSPGQDCAAGWSWRILSLRSEHKTSKNTSCWSWPTSEIILHSVSVMITVLLIQKRIEQIAITVHIMFS